jgi:hypothetical protein
MKKLLHFDTPQEVYTADACVISCFDARFDLPARKFLKRQNVFTYDHVKIPGGAKALAAPEKEADRDFVLRMVRISIGLHHPSRALLLGHADCGAYGGVPAEVVIADFDGIYLVE